MWFGLIREERDQGLAPGRAEPLEIPRWHVEKSAEQEEPTDLDDQVARGRCAVVVS